MHVNLNAGAKYRPNVTNSTLSYAILMYYVATSINLSCVMIDM